MITPKLTIEEVETEFAAWRSTKKNNSPVPIPESLCNQVRVLLQTYSRAEVLRRCGLTINQARKKGLLSSCPSNQLIHDSQELNSFVKISIPHSTVQKATILNLRCNDKHLWLENPTDEQVQLIITTLMR